MTSSNKARRYLQHHKQQLTDTQNNHQSAAELLIIDPTLAASNMRKFRARTQVSVPQICVDNDGDDEDNRHVAILNEFDEVLENELKRTSVLRTSSLKQNESSQQMGIPVSQQRSFSFALGSSTNLDGKKDEHDENYDEPMNTSSKSSKIKASLSKETFSRFLHSLAFRSGHHTTSKLPSIPADSCLACQQHSTNFDFIPKYKKRPSIFGVLVSKLNNTTTTNDIQSTHCPVCKRRLSKSVFYNTSSDENQQLSPTKTFHDQSQHSLYLRTKRRRSLPSLFHSLFDFDHHDKHHLDTTTTTTASTRHRPSFSSILTHTLIDSITREQQPQIQPTSPPMKSNSSLSNSSISLAESDASEENHMEKSSSSQLTEKVK